MLAEDRPDAERQTVARCIKYKAWQFLKCQFAGLVSD